jgi:hypothetical protein
MKGRGTYELLPFSLKRKMGVKKLEKIRKVLIGLKIKFVTKLGVLGSDEGMRWCII